MSELWEDFSADKVAMKLWKSTEAKSARTTLKLWTQRVGDRRPCEYSSLDVSKFHQIMMKLPSLYYHSRIYRAIYESEGVIALVQRTEGQDIQRLSDKTWNSHNSCLHGFFLWCASKGNVLPTSTESICKNEFVHIFKSTSRRTDDPDRNMYGFHQITTMFSAWKFMGCKSGRFWKRPGPLVFRDHRYWMTLIGAHHGNRREELVILRVKHVKTTQTGIWYFNWMAADLRHLLKDSGSPRDVPLHKNVLVLGFIEARVLGRDPEAMLFPEAVSYGEMERAAGPFGQWYGQFCTACGITDPSLDFIHGGIPSPLYCFALASPRATSMNLSDTRARDVALKWPATTTACRSSFSKSQSTGSSCP